LKSAFWSPLPHFLSPIDDKCHISRQAAPAKSLKNQQKRGVAPSLLNVSRAPCGAGKTCPVFFGLFDCETQDRVETKEEARKYGGLSHF
jgi:hypothetical protein